MSQLSKQTIDKQWFAIYTRSRTEKKVAAELIEQGYEAWIPLLKTMRQWSDRKKMVEVPLFNSYIFVRINLSKIRSIISKADGAVYVVSFSGQPAAIPDKQIEDLKLLLDSSEKFEISFNEFIYGDRVEVTRGTLKGLQGMFVQYKGQKRVLMHIDAINQKLLININPAFIKKMQQDKVEFL
jgi:transcription antitermination factor NusG